MITDSQLIFSLIAALALIGVPSSAEGSDGSDFVLVGEMEPLEGIVAQPRRQREALAQRPDGRRGLERLEAWVAAEWPRIRRVDLVTLSRFHADETRDFELPAEPGELTGRVVGHQQSAGLWFLELRGPRLPARYDIVHRYLYVYASFEPATGELGRLTVTIRGWVLE